MASKSRTINVDVKKSHLEKGVRGDVESCAVAMALYSKKYELPAVYPYDKDNFVSFTTKSGIRYFGKLPAKVAKKLRDYDDGVNIKPFSFELTVQPVVTVSRRSTPYRSDTERR